MELNIVNEVATLERLSVGQLRQRFAELFGEATQAASCSGGMGRQPRAAGFVCARLHVYNVGGP